MLITKTFRLLQIAQFGFKNDTFSGSGDVGWVVFFFVLTFSVGVWLNWTQQPPPGALGFWIMFVIMAIPAAKKATRTDSSD